MFDKLKASVGIGAAKVDTILNESTVAQGETVTGVVKIKAGKVNQLAEKVVLKLMTKVKRESEDVTSYSDLCIGELQIADSFEIEAGETYEAEFEFALHPDTPATSTGAYKNKCSVWIETEIDIDMALDPTDKDMLEVVPCNTVNSVLEIMNSAGYELYKADTEVGHIKGDGFSSTSGCYQELEFKARGSLLAQEVELSFIVKEDRVCCLAEKDRLFGGDSYYSFELNRNASDYEIKQALSMFV